MLASVIGLLPTQILNAYIGSTLRSMEDVILHNVNSTTSFLGYLAFVIQVRIKTIKLYNNLSKIQKLIIFLLFKLQMITTILLLVFVAKKARHEFNKTIQKDNILANTKLRLITA